jgi:uncharacterized protein (TIGR02266 family)
MILRARALRRIGSSRIELATRSCQARDGCSVKQVTRLGAAASVSPAWSLAHGMLHARCMRRTFEQQDVELARTIEEKDARGFGAEVVAHDTRVHPRRPIVASVSFESDSNFYTGVTGDISEGGVFIASTTLLPVGTELTILLSLAGESRPLAIRGVVRWVRDRSACGRDVCSGFGVQFTRISSEALATIARFVAMREIVLCDV